MWLWEGMAKLQRILMNRSRQKFNGITIYKNSRFRIWNLALKNESILAENAKHSNIFAQLLLFLFLKIVPIYSDKLVKIRTLNLKYIRPDNTHSRLKLIQSTPQSAR